MTQNPPKLSERLIKSLSSRSEAHQWEKLMVKLLERLELNQQERDDAERLYIQLGDHISNRLAVDRSNVHVFPQGSMRTQTTISPRGNQKFDLDIVVELSGSKYAFPDPEVMFAEFGEALQGNEAITGEPLAHNRCWRLPYPNKPFYFDVTPAIPDVYKSTGARLKVRDPVTRWSPSNPEEFATWFCDRAAIRFSFQTLVYDSVIKANRNVEPLPDEKIGLDDILRRTIQLMKLHRDNMYWRLDDDRKKAKPISVILVTLATHAFERLYRTRNGQFISPIEVVLAVVEEMPDYIHTSNGKFSVPNPALVQENFADKWNTDGGARATEFKRWHKQLENDLEQLLYQSSKEPDQDRIRSVFGNAGLDAWKESQPLGILGGLLANAAAAGEPHYLTTPVPTGSGGTLG